MGLLGFNSQRDGILRCLQQEQKTLSFGSFQFPTGWNSTVGSASACVCFLEFQFPTGWNSTAPIISSRSSSIVSIPNGMEFYAMKDIVTPVEEGFNSQRDGILRNMRLQTLNSSSFNSQRDGILPNFAPFNARCRKFQFPTGWNSTVSAEHLKYTQEIRFNSQRDGILPSTFKSCFRVSARFNSQRDGILHSDLHIETEFSLFQFPTGWNSTQNLEEIFAPFKFCFNSQRDGILPSCKSFGKSLNSTFQFPTGWNSTHMHASVLGASYVSFNSQRDGILQHEFCHFSR